MVIEILIVKKHVDRFCRQVRNPYSHPLTCYEGEIYTYIFNDVRMVYGEEHMNRKGVGSFIITVRM